MPSVLRGGVELAGWVRLQADLPASLASGGTLQLDLVSQGPGGVEIDDGAGPAADVPPTSYRGAEGVVLRRQGRSPWEDGYTSFVSPPVVLLADLQAMSSYRRVGLEEAACRRCDLVAGGVYPGGIPSSGRYQELLSGHRLVAQRSI